MIDALTFLYLVLAFGLIPVFVLLCMVLYRVYRLMDRADSLMNVAESVLQALKNIHQMPAMIANGIISRFNSWFK